jgi:hypothetical protein
MRGGVVNFMPKMPAEIRERRLAGWSKAVERVIRQ